MRLFRWGNKEPVIAKGMPEEVPKDKYFFQEPEQVTNSWRVGHTVFLYHGLDWIHLHELWSKHPITLYMN